MFPGVYGGNVSPFQLVHEHALLMDKKEKYGS
jgi:hypothetical protein